MGYTPPHLNVRKIAGGWSMTPPSNTTGDSLKIFANATDAYPYITLEGNGRVLCYSAAGTGLNLSIGGTATHQFFRDGTGCQFKALSGNDDVFLVPAGTGVVKFGTQVGTGDVACNGYIAIKDAAGNAQKLMTTA